MRIAVAFVALLLTACGSTSGIPCTSPLPADVAGQGIACGAGGHLAEGITPDKRTYRPGSPVVFTLTATNVSTEDCAAPAVSAGCPPLRLVVEDGNGAQVWATPNVPAIACPMLARLLRPGESASYPLTAAGLNLSTGVFSVSGQGKDSGAYGRAYFSVC
jgi:hypothetical protein